MFSRNEKPDRRYVRQNHPFYETALLFPSRLFSFGLIERGVPHRGVPQKSVCGRVSGATVRLGHVLRVFFRQKKQGILIRIQTALDMYRMRIHARRGTPLTIIPVSCRLRAWGFSCQGSQRSVPKSIGPGIA